MKCGKSMVLGLACFASAAVGCGTSRDVEVSGKVTAPSNLTVGDTLLIEFSDVGGGEGDTNRTLVSTMTLSAPWEFRQMLPLAGDQLQVMAIADRDGDGRCSGDEAWARTNAPIEKDKAAGITMRLQRGCPPGEG